MGIQRGGQREGGRRSGGGFRGSPTKPGGGGGRSTGDRSLRGDKGSTCRGSPGFPRGPILADFLGGFRFPLIKEGR